MATPTPMPAFAPGDSPLSDVVADAEGADKAEDFEVADEDWVRVGLDDVFEDVLVVVLLPAPKVCALACGLFTT
jgi:hypothetical protein